VTFQKTLSDLISEVFNDTKRRAVSLRQLSFLFEKRKILSFFLNVSRVAACLISVGIEHSIG